MPYEVWYNKQAPRNVTESPPTNLGFSGSPQLNQGISKSQTIGLGFAAARLIPAGKSVFNTFVNSTGDKLLQKRVKTAGTAIRIGGEIATLGLLGTAIVEGVGLAVEMVANDRQNVIDNINQTYNVQKRGVAVNKFVGVGERID